MATKTFEELKQLAIQIRDEKTNKQNTATRVGTAMLEHINKLEQDYYDKTQTDEELKERDDKLTELGKKYNIQLASANGVLPNIDTTKKIIDLGPDPTLRIGNAYYAFNIIYSENPEIYREIPYSIEGASAIFITFNVEERMFGKIIWNGKLNDNEVIIGTIRTNGDAVFSANFPFEITIDGVRIKDEVENNKSSIQRHFPVPLKTKTIDIGENYEYDTDNIIFSTKKMVYTSSAGSYQYAEIYFEAFPGKTIYAKCKKTGGADTTIRIIVEDEEGTRIIEHTVGGSNAYVEDLVPENSRLAIVSFILNAGTSLSDNTKVTFENVEVGYKKTCNSEILGICYNKEEIVVDVINRKIIFPSIRWYFTDNSSVGKSVVVESTTLSTSENYGGYILLDVSKKTYEYANLPSDTAYINLGNKYIVGNLHLGQDANFKAKFRVINSSLYESVSEICLNRKNQYPFTHSKVLNKTQNDETTDQIQWRANQSIAVYGNYIFAFLDYNLGTKQKCPVCIFDKSNYELIDKVEFPDIDESINHFNSAQFSTEKYEKDDEFPLLYISRCTPNKEGELYVLRVSNQEGKFNFELVQTIKTSNTSAINYGNTWCVDGSGRKLYMYYNESGNYQMQENNDVIIDKFDLPSPKDGDVLLNDSDVLSSIRFPFFVLQGADFFGGKIFIGAQVINSVGVLPPGSNQGGKSYIFAINFETNTLESVIPLPSGEPEGIAISDGSLYVSQRFTGQTNPEGSVFFISQIKFL